MKLLQIDPINKPELFHACFAAGGVYHIEWRGSKYIKLYKDID